MRDLHRILRYGSVPLGLVLLITTGVFIATFASGHQERGAVQETGGRMLGTVISADATEVVVRSTEDGRVIVVRVRNSRRADGTVGPDEDVSAYTATLKVNDEINVNYGYAIEGEFYFIISIQKASGESGAFMRDRNIVVGWVLQTTERRLTIESIEKGSRMDFTIPLRRRESGEREVNRELIGTVTQFPIGQLVLVSFRGGEGYGYTLNRVKAISF